MNTFTMVRAHDLRPGARLHHPSTPNIRSVVALPVSRGDSHRRWIYWVAGHAQPSNSILVCSNYKVIPT